MARFRATIKAQAGEEVHLVGTTESGVTARISGVETGVVVYGKADRFSDVFEVYMTYGSTAKNTETYLGTVRLREREGSPYFEGQELTHGQRLQLVLTTLNGLCGNSTEEFKAIQLVSGMIKEILYKLKAAKNGG